MHKKKFLEALGHLKDLRDKLRIFNIWEQTPIKSARDLEKEEISQSTTNDSLTMAKMSKGHTRFFREKLKQRKEVLIVDLSVVAL